MRLIENINNDWYFTKSYHDIPNILPTELEKVSLPHTYNGHDGQDGGNDYYRGKCLYIREISNDNYKNNELIYLEINGANSSAEVYIDGKLIVKHDGGYSTFRVNITDFINQKSLLVIAVDNAPNQTVYPQVADFTFYGGLYRDVNIISVPKQHFDLEYFGSNGIVVNSEIKDNTAKVKVKTYIKNIENNSKVLFQIKNKEVILFTKTVDASLSKAEFLVENVHLWNGVKDPFLYTATCQLICENEIIDEISTKFGCRTFSVDAQKGFILNNSVYPLRGVSRHQDRPEIGNALTFEHHKEDIDLICEMGANSVRLAHYQHSQQFYDLCDEKGLIVWAEIPYISKHMSDGIDNTISQMTELICQNYNHPSIVVWGLSNEITMNRSEDKTLITNHKKLNDLAHSLDKTRLITQAVLSMCSINDDYLSIPDVISYNHYFGWYGGNVNMYGIWFDDFHKKFPNRPIGLSEYGCEALNWHTSKPEQGDYTEEYQAFYHEELIKQISARPYLWSTYVWNMFDFAADARAEGGENGMNHKGLITFDRKYKKDAFYAYKAWLSDEKFVHICSKKYIDRVENVTKITVYSNCDEIELFANGNSVGKQAKGEYPFFYFNVDNIGKTKITVKSGDLIDEAEINKVENVNQDYIMKEANQILNWFEIETPANYFSVNDTIGDILKTFKGKLFAIKMIKMAKGMLGTSKSKNDNSENAGSIAGFEINKTMINFAKGFTVKRVLLMANGMFTKEQILEINSQLNKIKKKSK